MPAKAFNAYCENDAFAEYCKNDAKFTADLAEIDGSKFRVGHLVMSHNWIGRITAALGGNSFRVESPGWTANLAGGVLKHVPLKKGDRVCYVSKFEAVPRTEYVVLHVGDFIRIASGGIEGNQYTARREYLTPI